MSTYDSVSLRSVPDISTSPLRVSGYEFQRTDQDRLTSSTHTSHCPQWTESRVENLRLQFLLTDHLQESKLGKSPLYYYLQYLTCEHRGVLHIGGHTTINLHLGNPPLTQMYFSTPTQWTLPESQKGSPPSLTSKERETSHP